MIWEQFNHLVSIYSIKLRCPINATCGNFICLIAPFSTVPEFCNRAGDTGWSYSPCNIKFAVDNGYQENDGHLIQ